MLYGIHNYNGTQIHYLLRTKLEEIVNEICNIILATVTPRNVYLLGFDPYWG